MDKPVQLPALPAFGCFSRSAYFNYDRDAVSRETGLKCEDPSLAVQSQADEADINTIVKRFGVTGQLPEAVRIPQYGDFRGPSDFQSSMEYVAAAQSAFLELPAALRAEFNNDPGEFLAYVEDPRNAEAVRDTFGVEIEGLSYPESNGPPKYEGGDKPGTNSPPSSPPTPDKGA